MNRSDSLAFAALFREAYQKCFGLPLEGPVSETESKLFCNQVLERTGLSIGWKSVKNYSLFIIDPTGVKAENPSVATLDTLARYVLQAPYTTEIKRKNEESHFPYWFLYKERFNKSQKPAAGKRWRNGVVVFVAGIGVIILSLIYFNYIVSKLPAEFSENFKSVSGSSLTDRGWFVKYPNQQYWDKRAETPGTLSLFTLKGDNWPDPANQPQIKNLLLRKIPYDCFTAEVHLSDFIPKEEWQQAGIILLEDTVLTGKSVRLSVAYNDLFGGYHKSKEVLIQAITSLGNGFGKPEEIAHTPVVFIDSVSNSSLNSTLSHSALRIQKQGKKFRFLYSGGTIENAAFREIVSQEFDMQPKYIGIFAIKGFKDSASIIPAHFTFFRVAGSLCSQ